MIKTEELKSGKFIAWYEGCPLSPFAKGDTAEQAAVNLKSIQWTQGVIKAYID